jgi:hypothetical protein
VLVGGRDWDRCLIR